MTAAALTGPVRFDFGTATSPVDPDSIGVRRVSFSETRGYGWETVAGITAVDRGTDNPLTRDLHRGRNNTFLASVPNGSYQITAVLGDPRFAMDRVSIFAEGEGVAKRLASDAGSTTESTFNVEVTDGQLNLQFRDSGGANPYFALAALNVRPLQTAGLAVSAGADRSAAEGEAVAFAGETFGSGGSQLTYVWNFGDGTEQADTLTPSHAYRDNGTFTVTLTVTDPSSGASATDTAVVRVSNTAPAVTLAGPTQAAVGAPVAFAVMVDDAGEDDRAAGFSYLWNFGDGSTSTQADPGHTYAAAGTYTVRLTVTDKDGSATSAQTTVRVTADNPGGLTVNAGADRTAQEGQVVSFAGSASGGSNLTYHWDFGDGIQQAGTLTPTHTYRDNGDYIATLTVTAADGTTAQDTLAVTVSNVAPTASAGGPYRAGVGAAVAFSATVTDPGAADQAAGFTYLWDFGNGSTSTAASPSHAYAATGTYTVRLTVTDKDGGATTVQTTATVDPVAPPPGLVVNAGPDRSASEGQSVAFSGTASGGNSLTYSWDFGDGTGTTGTLTPSHVFADNGTYLVTLTVTDALGRSAQDTLQVSVANVAPSVALGGPFSAPVGGAVVFTPTVSDPGTADQAAGFSYSWDFGDGSTSSAARPSHAYGAAGSYTVTLTVTDRDGATGTASATVTVSATTPPPVPGGSIQTPFDVIPNFGANPTITAVASGNWSNPSTWSLGRLPTANDIVAIGGSRVVTYDQVSDAALKTVAIQSGGQLTFRTDINTRVVVQNFLVMEGGTLTIGTQANPVAAGVKAEVIIANTPINLSEDPLGWGNGLIALGRVTMHGAATTSGAVRLAAEPRAGDTTLRLAQPVTGWAAGDRLVLAGTRQSDEDANHPSELLTLSSVSADGRTLTLAAPLQYDHLGAYGSRRNNSVLGGLAAGRSNWLATPVQGGDQRERVLDFLPHVANLTRNVAVKSQSATGVRGHVVFTHNADADIHYASFAALGRTTHDDPVDDGFGTRFDQGRYPVQFRHLSDRAAGGARFVFEDNAVFCPLNEHTFRWGIDVHDARNGLISENVLYNWAGANLFVEDVASHGNVVEKNFSVAARWWPGADRYAWGRQGEGFAFWGTDNVVRDNVASSTGMYGYAFYTGGPFREFARNEVYGSRRGMTMWEINGAGTAGPNPNAPQSTVKDLVAWGVYEYGVGLGYPSYNVTFDGLVLRGVGQPSSLGWSFGDYQVKDFTIRNADIQGFYYGIDVPLISLGTFTVENSYLRNDVNINRIAIAAPGGGAPVPRTVVARNVRFESTGGSFVNHLQSDPILTGWNNVDWRLRDTFTVYDYNGVAGDNFQVFWHQSAANAMMPVTDLGQSAFGAPVAGLTNQQAWDQYGIAFGGAIAPADATTRNGIDGLVRRI